MLSTSLPASLSAASRGKAKLDYVVALGAVTSVMMKSPLYCQYPIACIHEWIRPPILHGQYQLFSDAGGNVVGYMTWAFLAKDAEARLLHDPAVLFHLSEWNEGDCLWIMDFVVINHQVRPFVRAAHAQLAAHKEARWLRRRDNGVIRKIMYRRSGA